MKASYKKRYKSLLNSLSAGIVVHDTHSRIIDYNQKAKEIFGFNTENTDSVDNWCLLDENGALLSSNNYPVNQILQTGEPISEKVIGLKKQDKSVAWLKVNGHSVKDQNDEICEVVLGFIDISKERVAKQRSEDKERAFQRLFQTMSQGVIYQDIHGNILAANPSAEKILNMDAEQMKGMNSSDDRWKMIDEEGYEVKSINHPAMLALQKGEKVGPVVRGVYVPERETYIWLKITAIPQFKDGAHKPWSAYTTFDDITEQKEKDAKLRKLSTAVEQSPVSIMITDIAGSLEYVNPHFETLTGYSQKEVLGKNPRFLNSGEQKPEFYKKMWSTIHSGKTWKGEFKNRKKNGDLFWESANISPVLDEQGVKTNFLAVKEDITLVKNQELKLKENEKRFREIFETLPNISVQGYNANREVIYWNKASEHLYGFTREQAMGKKLEDLIIPDEMKQEVIQNIHKAIENDIQIPSSELVLKHADGSPVTVYSNHTMLADHFGNKELYCIDIDLTELKEKELKLRNTEERYRSIIEVSDIGAWEYDIEKNHIWLSPETFSMLGYEPEKVDYNPGDGVDIWKDNLHPDDSRRAFEKFSKYLKGDLKKTYQDQFRLQHKNGSSVWVLMRARALSNPDGTRSKTILGTHIDITDRKLYEEKIKESELYHRSLLKTIPDLIFVLDREGKFLDYNATEDNLYIDGKDFLGRRVQEIFPDDIALSHLNATELAFTKNGPVEFQYSLFENGSKREFSSKVAAFGQDKVITVVRDISERISNIRKLEDLLHIKEKQNKKLSNFTHIVSHNLRTHSANMKGLLTLLESERPELYEDEYMKMVSESVNYLGDTIDNLNQVLKIHNSEHDNVPVINIYSHLEKAIKGLKHTAKEASVEIINCVPQNAKAQALPTYIDSIIQNMLTNAIKYREEARQSFVKIFWEQKEHHVILKFEDNGVGIDLDLYGSKIFGMYQTFHSNKDSVGLGLFITKSQIEEMGGSVQVTSGVGSGTTFKIRLLNGKN